MLYNIFIGDKMAENNPLRKYFRQPAIYITLPSKGAGYPPGALDLPPNGEIPVFPMTAMDEIVLRTPDALFNGSSNIKLFNSCVPNIKDAWSMPGVDIDLVLTAIRIASYGHEMSIGVKCPKCEEENDYSIDLRHVIDNIKAPDYTKTVKVGDLEIYFKPMQYKDINASARKQFEQQRLLQATMDENTQASEEERLQAMSNALLSITELTVNSIVNNIHSINTGEELVSDPAFIEEFLQNTSKNIFDRIQEHITSLRESTQIKPLTITCANQECNHSFTTPFTMDQANFFGSGS